MKNLLFCLLLPCMFLLGNTSSANEILVEKTIIDGIILVGKSGNPICTFSIPDKYYGRDGELILPLKISITKNNKTPVLLTQSSTSNVLVAKNLSGTYYVSLRIGDFYCVQKIVI